MKLCNFNVGLKQPLFLIAGPCVIESETMIIDVAGQLKEMTNKLNIPYIFKSSFDKAKRSSNKTFRGFGMEEGLRILEAVKKHLSLPVLTDIHTEAQVKPVAEIADVLQTPAFLCRQTDFILKVSSANKPVNIKKGQFTSPEEMKFVLEKAYSTGNKDIYLCERGYMFGYNNLVSDMRSLVIMKENGCPIVYDASHSVQKPGANKGVSSGDSKFISPLAKAAVAIGIDGLFIETHPNPESAISDGDNSLNINQIERLLKEIVNIDSTIRNGV